MKMFHSLTLAIGALVLSAGGQLANASLITVTYDVSATFAVGPVPTLTGSFTLTFDPAVGGSGSVTVNSLNITAGPAGFINDPTFLNFGDPVAGKLIIGGTLNGIGPPLSNTNDFEVDILHPQTTPVFGGASYMTAASNIGFGSGTGSVSVGVAAVPGPIVGAGLPGLVMALSWLVAFTWRRRKVAA